MRIALPTPRARPATVAAVLPVVLLTVLILPRLAVSQSTVLRLDAGTAVEAGLTVSQEVFDDGATGHVILVRDDTFADALVAGPLSGELPDLAPILFTPSDDLPADVAAEIDRVTGGTAVVHVIGGPAAVSLDVEAQVEAAGHTVQRVFGPSRTETALAVYDTYFAADIDGGDVMIARAFGSEASGTDAWPDAITGGGFGAARGVPVLLSPTAGLPDGLADALQASGAGAALVLGGTAALSADVESELAQVVDEVLRVAGATREETGVAVATELFGITALQAEDRVVLVNGRDSFAYGLAASALSAAGSGTGEAPLLLVTTDGPVDGCDGGEAAAPTACYLAADGTAPGEIVIVGDTSQVSQAVEDAVVGLRGQGTGDDRPAPTS